MSATPPQDQLGVLRWAQLNGFPYAKRIARDAQAHTEALERWLDERGLSRDILADLPETPVTLDQWAQFIEENPVTVKSWQRRPDWNVRPQVAGPRWATRRRGKAPDVYSLTELEAYPRPRDRRIDPELFEEGEHLTLYAIAVRAGLEHAEDLYKYRYRGYEGFPPPVEGKASAEEGSATQPHAQELHEARAVAEWFNRLPGRRGRRAR
ncbi:hypothetical protein NE857_33860 (plasmid) [Nocardiopsis exhalans]|uniref:Uncharacterized protein n=1 Tax=Nocardiopsis exhalans TaxID=163604 RepID=A0ABY5DJS4_9ACTN|nr:hypothetical protein [Nocardiopsis exhalans]USY23618.1 hypothetical protein NE857_33860 [Nocardiopsis exhalans]